MTQARIDTPGTRNFLVVEGKGNETAKKQLGNYEITLFHYVEGRFGHTAITNVTDENNEIVKQLEVKPGNIDFFELNIQGENQRFAFHHSPERG